MKRVLLLLCLCLWTVFVFSSCEKSSNETAFETKKTFELQMTAEKNEEHFEAMVICRGYNDMSFDFTYPEELKEFSVSVSGDGYSLDVAGFKDLLNKEELSNASLLNILTTAINVAVYSNNEVIRQTDRYEAQLLIDSTPVTVFFTTDGYISEISVPSAAFYAQFQKSG